MGGWMGGCPIKSYGIVPIVGGSLSGGYSHINI